MANNETKCGDLMALIFQKPINAVVRPAKPRDIERIAKLEMLREINDNFDVHGFSLSRIRRGPMAKEMLTELRKNCGIIMATVNGRVAGYGSPLNYEYEIKVTDGKYMDAMLAGANPDYRKNSEKCGEWIINVPKRKDGMDEIIYMLLLGGIVELAAKNPAIQKLSGIVPKGMASAAKWAGLAISGKTNDKDILTVERVFAGKKRGAKQTSSDTAGIAVYLDAETGTGFIPSLAQESEKPNA